MCRQKKKPGPLPVFFCSAATNRARSRLLKMGLSEITQRIAYANLSTLISAEWAYAQRTAYAILSVIEKLLLNSQAVKTGVTYKSKTHNLTGWGRLWGVSSS